MRLVDRAPGGAGGTVVLALGLGVLAFAVGAQTLEQYDLPWHLAFGRQLVGEKAIPSVDSFSFAGSSIRYVSVVSDVLLYGLHQLGGALALQMFGAAMAVAVALILVCRSLEHAVSGVALTSLGLFALHPWFTVRPATTTFVFMAGLLALIEVHRKDPGGRRGKAALWFALALMPLWANCHGGAVIGLLVLFLYAGYRTLATIAAARFPNLLPSSDRGALLLTWLVAVLAPALVLVNPAGVSYFTSVVLVESYGHLIDEWKPTSLDFFVNQLPAATAFFVLSACIFALGRERSGSRVPPLYELVLVAAAFVLITKARFVPVAIIVLAPIVARRMVLFRLDTAKTRILLASTVAVAGVSIICIDRTTYGIGWEPKQFPEAAVSFVEEHGLQGRMWNFWPWGGYLIWRLYPDHLVSLDGRFGMVAYERDYVLRAHASDFHDAPFHQMVAEYDIEWAFCYAKEGFVSCRPVARDPAWTMVYWDDLAAIYVKRDGRNRALAASGYRVFRHLVGPEQWIDLALRGVQRDSISRDGALARAQNPDSTRALFLDAVGALAADDGARFLGALQALGEIAPYHPALPALLEIAPRMRAAVRNPGPGSR